MVILVVDDDVDVLELYVDVLETRTSCVVRGATNAADAAAIARDLRLDLLISDVEMPGTTGTQLAKHLRQLRPGLPVVLVSGGDHADDAREVGAAAFLAKPITPAQLVETVARILGGEGGIGLTGGAAHKAVLD